MTVGDELMQEMRNRQRRQPEQWTMTIRQWMGIADHCKRLQRYQ